MAQLFNARPSLREVQGSIPKCDLLTLFKDFRNLYLGALIKRERKRGRGKYNKCIVGLRIFSHLMTILRYRRKVRTL